MRKALRRAARLLLAAGALGLARPAPAEFPAAPADAAPAASRAVQPVGISPVHPTQAQLEGMRVEMAWLGDLVTFGHQLEVRPRTDALEVCGSVPDDGVRARAFEVARRHTYMPLVDRVRVVGSSGHAASLPAPDLHRAVVEHLAQTFGPLAADFEVQAGLDGQVTVQGSVNSVEDKLAVSRALSQLAVCTAVHNDLTVTPVVRQGGTATLVTRDGSRAVRGVIQQVSGEAAGDDGAVNLGVAPLAAAGQRDSARVVSSPPATPILLPPTPSLAVPSGSPGIHSRPAGACVAQVVGGHGAVPADAVVTEPEARPSVTVGYTPMPSAPAAVPQGVVLSAGACESCGCGGSAEAPAGRGRLLGRITAGLATCSKCAAATTAAPQAQAVTRPYAHSALDTRQAAPLPPDSGAWPAAYATKPAVPAVGVRPAAAAEAVPADEVASADPTRPENGVVQTAGRWGLFGGSTPSGQKAAPAPAQAPAPTQAQAGQSSGPVDPARLQRQVQAACGGLAKKVQVTRTADKGLKVHVEVPGPAGSEKPLVEKILQIPDMLAPGVQLDLHVGP